MFKNNYTLSKEIKQKSDKKNIKIKLLPLAYNDSGDFFYEVLFSWD